MSRSPARSASQRPNDIGLTHRGAGRVDDAPCDAMTPAQFASETEQVLVALAPGGAIDAPQIACRIARLSVAGCGVAGSAIFRSVHDTGLLVPIGQAQCAPAGDAGALASVMARAVDHAVASATAAAVGRSTTAVRRRTTAPGGKVLWTTVLYAAPMFDDAPADIDTGQDRSPGAHALRPQMVGVWVTVSQGTSDTAGRRGASARRVLPLVQLLLCQIALREAATSARRQTEKRLREMAAVYDIGRAIDYIEIDELLDLIVHKAADVMEAQACSLMLINDATDQLVIAAACGLPDDVVENTRVLIGEGIAGRVAQTGEPVLVQYDARNDPRFSGSRPVGLPGIASSIVMPMFNELRQVRGVLCIRRRTPSAPFSEEDKRLFSIFATQAGLAIKNVRLYRQLRSRVQEMSTLASLTEAISSTLDLDFVLSQVADSLVELVGFDRCLLYLKDDGPSPADEKFSVRVSRGFENLGESLPATSELIREISARLVPILKEEADDSLPLAVDYARSMGLRSFFAQPVVVRGNAIGVLVVSNDFTHRPIAYSNLDLLSTFLQHAGIAIDNARLYAQMERRVRELHSLYAMSQSLTTTYGLSRACATVAKVAKDMARADGVLVMLFNDRLDSLRIREHNGLSAPIADRIRLLADSHEVSPEARSLREPISAVAGGHLPFRGILGMCWQEMMDSLAREYPALLLAPLVTEDTVVGFVVLGRSRDYRFRPDETKLISIISSQAGAVLRGAALYEQSIHQRVLELSALYELSKKVRTARSLTDAFDAILDIVASVTWCDAAEIGMVDAQRSAIVRQVFRGEIAGPIEVGVESRTIAGWVLRERKALLIADVASDSRFADSVATGMPSKSLMAIPVFLGDEVLAVLQVHASVSGLYNEDNVKMLSLIAAQAAALFRDLESLRQLTTYTDSILRSIAAAVVTVDATGCVTTVNAAAERILRVRESELAGNSIDAFIEMVRGDGDDAEDIRKMVSHAIQTRQIVQRHRLRLYAGAGEAHPEPLIVNGSASQLLSERGEYLGVVLVFEDITKEDEMEQELGRISRLAEIGQLAAGIAHELRNPLASIKGAAQVLREDLTPDLLERHGEFLDIIVREADGLNAVTTEFLEFSRPTSLTPTTLSLNSLLERRLSFMQAEFAQFGVQVHMQFDPDLPDILADANQLERVFLNIIVNAVQAMPDGGTLTVKTASAPDPDGRDSEREVEVSFVDTGLGIPDSRMEKIFAPFFTTKTKGTGLGLSIVQKIVDSHGGRIHLRSEVAIGTAFTIYLPVSSAFEQRMKLQAVSSPEIADERRHAARRGPIEPWTPTAGAGSDPQ